jgi:hypothetical protein
MATVRHLGLFPFCILDPANDPNSSLVQMEMSVDLGLYFWWRVKKWTVDSASLDVIPGEDDPGGGGPIFIETGEMTIELPAGGISSEKELVCPKQRQFVVGNSFSQVAVTLRIFPRANQSGDLIKMDIDVRASIQTTTYFYGNGGEAAPHIVGTGTITVQDRNLIFPIGGDFEGTGSLAISATEYWPYDPGDGGGPIYDSVTGAQLRGFPS